MYLGDEVAVSFRKKRPDHMHVVRHAKCKHCEQEERDAKKQANRHRQKARDTLARHADKFIRKGLCATRDEFADRFGWDLDRMEFDIRHAEASTCPCCVVPFTDMPGGLTLSGITLDIHDRGTPPYYGMNTRWLCMTCNRQKGSMTVGEYAAFLRGRRRYDDRPAWPVGSLLNQWVA